MSLTDKLLELKKKYDLVDLTVGFNYTGFVYKMGTWGKTQIGSLKSEEGKDYIAELEGIMEFYYGTKLEKERA